ncbi:MAG TPA: hypothetical protein PKI55_04150 [Chitinophagaceae bacterium]|nr:hypothetical protein [Chitinophagaceae bacterium]
MSWINVKEAIDIRLLGNEDYQKRDRLRLMKWSKYVYQDLNLSVVKKAIRKRMAINKRTNSIDLPCNSLQLSSVSVIDKCGIEYPVYRNRKIFEDTDIVDVSAKKDCECEYKCNSPLCNLVKGYEAVVSTKTDKNPDGSEVSFECIDRKAVDDQGFFYEQLQYPKRIYEDGVWTETVLFTENRKLCKVEVDENGCVCDTEENLNNICTACGIDNINQSLCCIGGDANTPPDGCDTWIYYCNNKLQWLASQCGGPYICPPGFNNIYNLSELGDRIIFPANFGWDEVMVRYYTTPNMKDIEIPFVAIDTFILGLMWWDCRFNDKKQALAQKYSIDYSNLKFGLLKELNKYRIQELGMIFTIPAFIPSYTYSRTDKYEGSNLFYRY